ncbi:hypothetical protein CCICO_04325 [Corynebacterium ciconiae DSM 44920]|uniref:hypothetical protein n=1 Tax=Corynebacterium ciconiae TaxID=227319 RepID=UPI002647D8DB|nr:hypothetical protein [Corynebacterium ciconiae]WKD60902.1 hypothetical protein CCICO_04325 [Corynebacterium ciconiae DSM 44920]
MTPAEVARRLRDRATKIPKDTTTCGYLENAAVTIERLDAALKATKRHQRDQLTRIQSILNEGGQQ